jgi:hypothetical protein
VSRLLRKRVIWSKEKREREREKEEGNELFNSKSCVFIDSPAVSGK